MDCTSLIKEVNIPELVKALRCCAVANTKPTKCPDYGDSCGCGGKCLDKHLITAAAAIEELEKERDYYKQQYENRQRLIKIALGEAWT